MKFFEALTLVFIVLKLIGVLDWSWAAVLSPVLFLIFIYIFLKIIEKIIDKQ